MSHWDPKLRVAASGYSGSGYRVPTRLGEDGKPLLVPGVTTVLGALDRPGVLQWSIDNTAAYAVANVDALLNRTEEQGFGFLRFYAKRMKESDFDDPMVDIRNYSNGVLNDLAELGSLTHDWIADFVNDFPEPDLTRNEQADMIEKFLEWYAEHEIEVVVSEVTVVGDGYAGTLDHIWIIDGIPTLVDVKTSRATRDEHFAQLAALGAADAMMVEVPEGTPGAVEYTRTSKGVKHTSYWIERPVPAFSQYAILHLRPNDYDSKGNFVPAFCELKIIEYDLIEAAFELFEGALKARHGQARLKAVKKALAKEDEDD